MAVSQHAMFQGQATQPCSLKGLRFLGLLSHSFTESDTAAPLPSSIAVLQQLTSYQKKGRTYILFRTWLTVALVTLCSSESLDVVTNSCSGAGTGSIHLFSYGP